MKFTCRHCDFVSKKRPEAVAHLRDNRDENGEFTHTVDVDLGAGSFQVLGEHLTTKD